MLTDAVPQIISASGILPPIEHTTFRTYTSFPGANYILPSDEKEKERLNYQHYLLKGGFEDRILVAPISLQPGNKVLDSGTGTGVWLIDLAKSVPNSVEMYGVDIESRLFPSANQFPDTIKFSIASSVALPHEWKETFSLVHQRLLIGALQRTEWPMAVQEMHRVLVPGGWVQLLEVGDAQSGPVHKRYMALLQALYESRNLMRDCSKQIPHMLIDAGFVNVHVEKRDCLTGKWAGQVGIDGARNAMEIWRGTKIPIMKAGGLGIVNSEEEFDQLLVDLEKEYDDTPGSYIEWVMIYAQKPLM